MANIPTSLKLLKIYHQQLSSPSSTIAYYEFTAKLRDAIHSHHQSPVHEVHEELAKLQLLHFKHLLTAGEMAHTFSRDIDYFFEQVGKHKLLPSLLAEDDLSRAIALLCMSYALSMQDTQCQKSPALLEVFSVLAGRKIESKEINSLQSAIDLIYNPMVTALYFNDEKMRLSDIPAYIVSLNAPICWHARQLDQEKRINALPTDFVNER